MEGSNGGEEEKKTIERQAESTTTDLSAFISLWIEYPGLQPLKHSSISSRTAK